MPLLPALPLSVAAFRPAREPDLPVYRRDAEGYSAFYAPGLLCVVHRPDAERFVATIAPADAAPVDWGVELWRRARSAMRQAGRQRTEPFEPECLTLYLNGACNLHCVYCYAAPGANTRTWLGLDAVAAAARLVARYCREKDRPFYAVLHGGGEPALSRRQLERVLGLLDAAAVAYGVETFYYLATNGVMPEDRAAWLARSFDLVGLSCDGPADIHDLQRPGWDGSATLHEVERTAHILRQEGCPLHVRATITPASLTRQAEIADYFCRQFAPQEIHFEPVYLGGRAGPEIGLGLEQVEAFVDHFREARALAHRQGVPLLTSGSRPGSIHGPYCNLFRQVLNLVPGGEAAPQAAVTATACFKMAHASQVAARGVGIGSFDRHTGRFEIDGVAVEHLRQRLGAVPLACETCFNRYHCAGDCPDLCLLDLDAGRRQPEQGFRCRVQMRLTAATLHEAAEALWREMVARGPETPHGCEIP